MAEVTIKRTGELIQKLFQILSKYPEGLPARDALKQLSENTELTDYEKGTYATSGANRFEKIVRFATVSCGKAGWMTKHKGTWTITDEGGKALEKFADPESFYREASKLYRKWKLSKADSTNDALLLGPDVSEAAVEGSAQITFEEAEEQAWSEIEQHFAKMPPYELQRLVADLLEAMGYFVSWISPPGKDGGIDVIAHIDALGTKPPRIKVQVKREKKKTDLSGLKSFMSNVNEDDVGIFVAIGGFTKDAEDHARNQEKRKITLIDAERLVELWIQFLNKHTDASRKRLPLTPIYFLTPDD